MLNVLVVGKINCLVAMTENTVAAFQQAGCNVRCFATNGNNVALKLSLKLRRADPARVGALVGERLSKSVKAFRPDLLVYVLGAWQPEMVYQMGSSVLPQAISVAWVSDNFTQTQMVFSRYMDSIFCTDTYFIQQLREHGYTKPTSYLPLAMDPKRFYPSDIVRENKIVYVAKNSPGRAAFIRNVERPLHLYGKKWKSFSASQHRIDPRPVSLGQLSKLYASSRAVLNLKNEQSVVRGINQRSFEPYGCKTPVLNDDIEDLKLCFELGKEILVYRSVEELHTLHDKLTSDQNYARAVGEAGYRRVIAEHTYAARATALLQQTGLV